MTIIQTFLYVCHVRGVVAIALRSRATEYELVIVAPAVLLRVHTGLHLSAAVRSRATAADHAKPGVLQSVERLLDERVFEIEACRVTVGRAAVWVSALVQRVAEHLATDGHASADENSRDFAELDVRQAVASELERAAISYQDEARLDAVRSARRGRRRRGQTGAVGRRRGGGPA